ncbi:unnamed protein product [Lymnaea stagnalis]|uniref:Transmembrane protein 234 n=1 Tax=Lymnaea stagnalis TaxID=6523 RepID=A0AAV2IBX6_LYMST
MTLTKSDDAFWLLVVAVLWGATNPLLKQYSQGVEKIKCVGSVAQFFSEFTFLFFNWQYLLSFLTNQMGSVIYYITLASAELTLAVPITNSLTLIFTSLSASVLGERNLTWKTGFGMLFIMSGVLLCVMSKGDTLAS